MVKHLISLLIIISFLFQQGSTQSNAPYYFIWPEADNHNATEIKATIEIKKNYIFDGEGKTFFAGKELGSGDQGEGQKPLFKLADGSTIKNVIIDKNGADGIHCKGSCNIENVWFLKVGEDAITFSAVNKNATLNITGGGARQAVDKVIQHNGPGTVNLKDYQAEFFGKLYRSCGNCRTQFRRFVNIENVKIANSKGTILGINGQYPNIWSLPEGDRGTIKNLKVKNFPANKICVKYYGNNQQTEPTSYGYGPDGKLCVYTEKDVSVL